MKSVESVSWISPEIPIFRLQKTPHCWKLLKTS